MTCDICGQSGWLYPGDTCQACQSAPIPYMYSVELTYPVKGKHVTDILIRNQSRDDARRYARDYRTNGYGVRILAYPAIPYTLPYTPGIVPIDPSEATR